MAIQTLGPLPKLKLNKAGKPAIPAWVPPPETKEDLEWQSLRVLDLSLLDGTPEQQAQVQQTAKDALTNEGFLLIENHGASVDDLQRIFDIANWVVAGGAMTEEDKKKFEWDRESGEWMGYKPPYGWGEKGRTSYDYIEAYNFYGACWEEGKLPPGILPFADEILAYADHMHNQVGRRLYTLLSRILGLPDDYLWNKIPGKNSVLPYSSYCRFQVYHPVLGEGAKTTQNILPNHTDHGATTLLPSQPVTCLQMLGQDQKWRYVPYKKGALVCNLGDVMEILSGGIFKATRHRVCKPPADQAEYARISVCSFNHADQNLVLEPIHNAPLVKQMGLQMDSEVYGAFCKALSAGEEFGEWKTLRNKNAQEPTSKYVEINGVPHREHIVGGVKVYRQI